MDLILTLAPPDIQNGNWAGFKVLAMSTKILMTELYYHTKAAQDH
jgi:hypothetical protein